jgi:transposase-like protein
MRGMSPDDDFKLPPLKQPPPNTRRWTPSRKAAVVMAVREGVLSLEEACRRYTLSPEEFAAWEQAMERHGIHGLRVTRFQIYRDTE